MTKRFHVISLQRSASKSLVNLLDLYCQEAPGFNLSVEGKPLSEYLHAWGQYGFKYDTSLASPYAPDAKGKIWFHDSPGFEFKTGKSFRPLFDPESKQFKWQEASYLKTYDKETFRQTLDYLHRVVSEHSDANFVLKTQLASMFDSPTQDLNFGQVVAALIDFHFDHGVQCIGLIRSDPAEWIMSNYLADLTGVFVPGKAQRDVIQTLRDQPTHIPPDYVFMKMLPKWVMHKRMCQMMCKVTIHSDYLSHPDELAKVLDLPKLSYEQKASVPSEREFSAGVYKELIVNVDQIKTWANRYFNHG